MGDEVALMEISRLENDGQSDKDGNGQTGK